METKAQDIEAVAASMGMTAEEYCKVLLAEYEEVGRSWRHDDAIAWQILRIFVPTSLAGFYIPFTTDHKISVVFVGALAILIVWMAFGFHARKLHHMRIRFARAQEIEAILGMNHHREMAKQVSPDYPQRSRIPKVRRLLLFVTLTITVLWVLAIVLRLANAM